MVRTGLFCAHTGREWDVVRKGQAREGTPEAAVSARVKVALGRF